MITNDINNAILSPAESSIPNKIVTIRKRGSKWLSCNIRTMIRQTNIINRKAKHFNNPMHWNKLRKIRNEATSLVRDAKDKYNNDFIKNMTSSCKNWWNIVKQISGIKGSDMTIPPILHNDNLIVDDIERANLFNIYFSKQSEIEDSNSNFPNLSHVTNQISEIKLCENELEDVLKVIKPTTASGPDVINPRLLKEATSIIKHPLCKLLNLSLRVASYPSQWKRANKTPVFKNNKQNDVKNYRPISLLNVISKCMERCVYKHIHNHPLHSDSLTICQSGFTKRIRQLINKSI